MSENIPKVARTGGKATESRLQGKVAIITGANSTLGIGFATAHQFARNGARAVFICDFADDNKQSHQQELKSSYPAVEIHPRRFDAADEDAVRMVVEEALSLYGRLDIMFANAGISTITPIHDSTAADFMKTMRTNTLSVFLATKYASKAMMQTSKDKPRSGGSIVATASVAGLRSNAGATDYSASKAAVVSIMQTACYQLAGSGIRCNAVCPGIIETGMTKLMYDLARARGTEKKIGQLNPLKRGAVSDEVANVVLFLASDEASYVNGQSWAVCGGLSAGHPFVPGKLA